MNETQERSYPTQALESLERAIRLMGNHRAAQLMMALEQECTRLKEIQGLGEGVPAMASATDALANIVAWYFTRVNL